MENKDDFDARISSCEKDIGLLLKTLRKAMDAIDSHQSDLNNTWKYISLAEERFKFIEKHDLDCVSSLKIITQRADTHVTAIELLRLDMMKMKDAYYHIFPERLEEDARFSDQLDALTSKAVSDADAKKL